MLDITTWMKASSVTVAVVATIIPMIEAVETGKTGTEKKSIAVQQVIEKLPAVLSELGLVLPAWLLGVLTNAVVLGYLIDGLVWAANQSEELFKKVTVK